MAGVPQQDGHDSSLLLYVDILEMYAGICCILSKCVSLDETCLSTLLHTHNFVHSLLALLDPVTYCEYLTSHIHCCVFLFSCVFWYTFGIFLSAILVLYTY